MPQIIALKLLKHVDIEHLPEQISYSKLKFTPHNLISLDLNSVIDVSKKLLAIEVKEAATRPPTYNSGPAKSDQRSGRHGAKRNF
jgi:hypothetical protein